MADSTDSLASKGYVLKIDNVRAVSEDAVEFKAFLTDLSDNFESSWNETSVYARMDPIWTFENTKRTISVSFAIPAYGPSEARANQEKLSRLARFLYPTYNISAGVATMSASPLFRVKYVNLIQNAKNSDGLLGVIQGFEFKPNLEMGFFPNEQKDDGADNSVLLQSIESTQSVFSQEDNILFAKEYELSFELSVLHEHKLGYSNQSGRFREVGENFPFRANLSITDEMTENFPEKMSDKEIKEAQAAVITDPSQAGGKTKKNKAKAWKGEKFYDPNKTF